MKNYASMNAHELQAAMGKMSSADFGVAIAQLQKEKAEIERAIDANLSEMEAAYLELASEDASEDWFTYHKDVGRQRAQQLWRTTCKQRAKAVWTNHAKQPPAVPERPEATDPWMRKLMGLA